MADIGAFNRLAEMFGLGPGEPQAQTTQKNPFPGSVGFTNRGRPAFPAPEGGIQSERTATMPTTGGRFMNVPTLHNGRQEDPKAAQKRVKQSGGRDPMTGRRLQEFETPGEAVGSARARSRGTRMQEPVKRDPQFDAKPGPTRQVGQGKTTEQLPRKQAAPKNPVWRQMEWFPRMPSEEGQ